MVVRLKEKINTFIEHIHKEFSLKEIFVTIKSTLAEDIPDLEKRILNIIKNHEFLFCNDDPLLFIPRSLYFYKARFLIVPTKEEIQAGILVPGHRFIPFCNPNIFPAECILHTEEGIAVEKTKVQMVLNDLSIYMTLLGNDVLPDYLICDDELNTEIFLKDEPEKKEIILTVFDMKKLYNTHHMTCGDAFVITVENWTTGNYNLSYISKEERGGNNSVLNRWIADLESGFKLAFNKLGIPSLMSEQLAHAFYYGGDNLIRNPSINIGAFLTMSNSIEIKEVGSKSFLWFKDEDIRTVDIIKQHIMKGDFDSLDDILIDINAPISSGEIEAYMRNELFHRGNSCSHAMEECFAYYDFTFYDKFQHKIFHLFINELWEKVSQEYNYFKDQVAGRLREKALELHKTYMEWLDALHKRGYRIDGLFPEDIVLVSHGFESLKIILETCNETEGIDNNENNDIAGELEKAEEIIHHIMVQVEKRFKPDLKLIKKGNPPSVFILTISLQDILPSIWRRIQTPGTMTLAELHTIIQITMGWEDYHLHTFTIEGVEYGLPSENESMGIEDESRVTLDDVLRKQSSTITYEYDFGDRWVHTIQVEKIIPIDQVNANERHTVKCLDGKRSCPPEDCGGIPGYEKLITILNEPSHPEYEDIKNWAGDFDPEKFDIELVNRLLSG
jgi:hypothetical protein